MAASCSQEAHSSVKETSYEVVVWDYNREINWDVERWEYLNRGEGTVGIDFFHIWKFTCSCCLSRVVPFFFAI